MQNAKCKMQNAKCKMQNSKFKMQNTKCKMQKAKCLLACLPGMPPEPKWFRWGHSFPWVSSESPACCMLRLPRGWWWAESYLTDIFTSYSRGVSEETKWSEKLGLEGKFLLLSDWSKGVWKSLIGWTKVSNWLILEGPWLVDIGQS